MTESELAVMCRSASALNNLFAHLVLISLSLYTEVKQWLSQGGIRRSLI